MEQATINEIRDLAGERIKTDEIEADKRISDKEIEEFYNRNNHNKIDAAISIWQLKKAEALDEREVSSEDIAGIKTQFMNVTDFLKICNDNISSLTNRKFAETPATFEFI